MELAHFLPIIVLYIVVDAAGITLTSFRVRFDAEHAWQMFTSDFTHSVFDVWMVGVFRTGILAFWSAMVVRSACRSEGTPSLASNVVKVSMLLTWMFAGAKLLALGEHQEQLLDRWVQAALAWTFVACVLNYLLVHIMQGRPVRQRTSPRKGPPVEEGEKQRLLSGKKADHGVRGKEDSKQKDWNRSQEALKNLARISLPDLLFILGGLLFLLASVACEITVPMFVGQTLDSLLIVKSRTRFHTALLRLIGVVVTSIVCTWIRLWMFCMYTARLTARIRNRFFSMVIQRDMEFFCEYQTGDLVSRLMTATGQVGIALSPNLDQFLRGFFSAVGVMFMMIQTSWRMTMLPVILLPALVGVSRAYGVMSRLIGASSQQQMGDMSDLAEEKFSSMVTVRSFAMEKHEIGRFAGLVKKLYGNGKKEAYMHGTFQSLALFVQAALLVSTILYGDHLIDSGLLNGGDLVTAVLYLNQISSSIQIMNAVYSGIMKGVGCSQLVFEPMSGPQRHRPIGGSILQHDLRGDVEFRDVTFWFASRPHVKVLDNVSFRVEPGEFVALVGPSGSGKSTCMALLQNFYQPRGGQVLLDGIPVQRFTNECLHANVALVDQEPALFACSVADNIKYGFSEGSDFDVVAAAKLAHAHDFVCAFPDGYETSCGERGLQMSGGQKQRLAIARALIRKPKVLILDETTSALDCQTEAQVQETVNGLRGKVTILWIAHHLNTVHIADRVLVLNKGRLVEDGPPSDLLTRGGLFASLVQQQLGHFVRATRNGLTVSRPLSKSASSPLASFQRVWFDKTTPNTSHPEEVREAKENDGNTKATNDASFTEDTGSLDDSSGYFCQDDDNEVPLKKRHRPILSYKATVMHIADSAC